MVLLRSILAVWLCSIFVNAGWDAPDSCGGVICPLGQLCRDDRCVCYGVVDEYGNCDLPTIGPPITVTIFPQPCYPLCSRDRICKNGECVCKSGREVFGKCVSVPTCPIYCPPGQYCKNAKCVCRKGNLHNGKCVVCRFPEVFKACPSNCPPTCEDNPDDPILCTKECKLSNFCVCAKGYIRKSKSDSTCVRKEECRRCPKPKVYNPCPTNCPGTCDNINNPSRICETVCRPGVTCVCPPGYVEKSSTDSTCVKPSQCRKVSICELPKDSGPCEALMPKFYFNAKTGRCQRFNYGGCLGNRNRFDTRRECEARCSICKLDKDPGPCEAAIPSYYYNRYTKRCDKFYYGGCEGNANRFSRLSACRDQCEEPRDPCALIFCPKGTICKNGECIHPCALIFCPKGTICKNGECVSICPEPKVFKGCSTSCPKTCENRFDPPRPCPAVCRPGVKCVCPDGYVERSSTDSTCVKESRCPERCPKPKVYDSCPTNCPDTCENINDPPRICATVCRPGVTCVCPRGYVEKSSTDSTCVKRSKCRKVPVCQQPKVTGPCKARIPKFFFNARTGKCEKFYYGGCQGNENRFDSRKECEAACNLCKLDKDVGPCDGDYRRYYYNGETGDCEEFSYGGCPGNANRFHTLRECRRECADPCILKFCPIGKICKKGQCVKRCGDGYCGDDGVCVYNKCICLRRPEYSEDCTQYY